MHHISIYDAPLFIGHGCFGNAALTPTHLVAETRLRMLWFKALAAEPCGVTSGLFGTFETMTHYFENWSRASCAQGPVDLMLDLELCNSQVKVI